MKRAYRRALAALLLAGLLVSCGGPAPTFDGAQRTSTAGELVGSVIPTPLPPPVGQMHTWTLHLETADGDPVEDATITVDGDMPAHGHGLPTQPRVTTYLGEGDYLVEGMQFQMGGEWFVEFAITAPGISDTLRFEFVL
jgi:hypothetical protein